MTAPDFFEPLIGFRAWHLERDGGLVPWSLSGAGAWVPGMNTAICHARKSHRSPAADCMCGLYALASARDPRLHGRDGQIVGAIVAWGDIELHRTGYRAEHAAVVARAEPFDGEHDPARRAAERYDVVLVPRAELELTARGFGQPVDPRVLDEPADRDAGRHLGETGIALVEHMWCRPDAMTLTLGITRAFADQLDDSIEITLPPPGTRIAARDPLATLHTRSGTLIAWACASGHLYERNERLLRDQSLLREDPEAGAWLARIVPSAWPQEARNFSWGPAGRTSYEGELGRATRGDDI
jgi:glycine cleavage system H lipoate-binding protein